jgi:parallel beta-helix repeat protein
LDGLIIMGTGASAGSVVLDPSPNTDAGKAGNTGPGLVIQSRKVTVKNMKFRNGTSYGVLALSDGVMVTNNVFLGQDVVAVYIGSPAAYGAKVMNNTIKSAQYGVAAFAANLTVSGNAFKGNYYSVYTAGEGTKITGNTFTGLYVSIAPLAGASNLTASGNTFTSVYVGLYNQSGAPTPNLTFTSNTFTDSLIGVLNACDPTQGSCSSVVQLNKFTNTTIPFQATSGSAKILNNTIVGGTLGIVAQGSGNLIQGNSISDTGYDSSTAQAACVFNDGDDGTISSNTVLRCGSDGVYVNGSRNLISKNTVTNAVGNGITIDNNCVDSSNNPIPCTSNQVDTNTTNAGTFQGIAVLNGADSTVVAGNKASGNRTDFCDDGVSTFESSNTFGTEATSTPGSDCALKY